MNEKAPIVNNPESPAPAPQTAGGGRPGTNPWKILSLAIFLLWLASVGSLVFYFKPEKSAPPAPTLSPASPTHSPSLTATCPTPADVSDSLSQSLPVVTYDQPGSFTEADKEELNRKIIQPFFAYYNETEINYIAMVIYKKPSATYEYSFTAIHKNGGTQGSVIFQKDSAFVYWTPTCMEPCEFTPAYRAKYPEVVQLTNP